MATEPIHPTKICTKCGAEKPATAKHFPLNGKWLRRTCRPCWQAMEREYRKNSPTTAARHKRRWANCDKAEARRKVDEWKAANPEKARAIEQRRLDRLRSDPTTKPRNAEKMRRWRAANPLAAAAARDRRRAREFGAQGQWTRADIREILKLQGRFCFYCSVALTKFECDHFIPLVRGGSNGPENIVLSCGPCNYSKAGRLPWEWMPERFSPGCKPR